MTETHEPRPPVPDEIRRQRKVWNVMGGLLRIAEVACVLIGIAGPIIVAMAPGLPAEYVLVAAISSLATLVAATLGLPQRANNWRAAWAGLNTAIVRYEMGLCRAAELADALEYGERLIQGIPGDESYARPGNPDPKGIAH